MMGQCSFCGVERDAELLKHFGDSAEIAAVLSVGAAEFVIEKLGPSPSRISVCQSDWLKLGSLA